MKALFFAIAICIAFSAYTQTQVPEFSFFSQEEKDLKECSFDREADAVIFFDKAVSSYNDDYNMETKRRIRFKILKESGIKHADIVIPFYSERDFETIMNVEAVILSLDDHQNWNLYSIDKKSIYTRKVTPYHSELTFTMPNVKVGSIIEFRYTSLMKSYGGLEDWEFQTDVPIMLSSYDLYIPPNAEFAYSVKKSRFLPIDIKPLPKEGRIVFEMKNVPGLRDEPYMAAAKDYLQRVIFQFAQSTTYKYATTWNEMSRELLGNKNFGGVLNKDPGAMKELKEPLATVTAEQEKIRIIFEHVRSKMSWNRVNAKFSDGIRDAWEKKQGTAADINFILISVLRAAGINAFPMLVSDRYHGKVDTTYPFLDQFNRTVAYIKSGSHQYVLDATDRETPWYMTPFELLNTTGFIVDKKQGGLFRIQDQGRRNMEAINVISNIDEKGRIRGRVFLQNYDYARIQNKNEYGSNANSQEQEYRKAYTGFAIDSFQVEGLESDSLPIKQNFIIEGEANRSAEYIWLDYNLFTGFSSNPFLSGTRFTNIDFGCRFSCTVNSSFILPDNFVVESIPGSKSISTAGNTMSISRTTEQTGKQITVGVKIEFNKAEFTAEEYSAVQGFYKQMFSILTEPIVLKSK